MSKPNLEPIEYIKDPPVILSILEAEDGYLALLEGGVLARLLIFQHAFSLRPLVYTENLEEIIEAGNVDAVRQAEITNEFFKSLTVVEDRYAIAFADLFAQYRLYLDRHNVLPLTRIGFGHKLARDLTGYQTTSQKGRRYANVAIKVG